MTDEGKLRQQASRAARAKTIMEDDLVKEAFEKIEAGIVGIFKDSAIEDDRSRRHAREALGILTNFRQQFFLAISTGEASAKEIVRIDKESKLRKIIRRG